MQSYEEFPHNVSDVNKHNMPRFQHTIIQIPISWKGANLLTCVHNYTPILADQEVALGPKPWPLYPRPQTLVPLS